MKALHGTGVAAVALAALAAACGGGDPDYTAELRRTQYGLVHVKADDYRGLGYGYGYAVAQDQLCLLSDRVRTLRGERSGRLGPDGPALVGFLPLSNLASDLFYRVQLSDEEVETAWAQLSADAQGLAEGYARGFSRYVREMKASDRDTACGGVEPLTMKADELRRLLVVGGCSIMTIIACAKIRPNSGRRPAFGNSGNGTDSGSKKNKKPSRVTCVTPA